MSWVPPFTHQREAGANRPGPTSALERLLMSSGAGRRTNNKPNEPNENHACVCEGRAGARCLRRGTMAAALACRVHEVDFLTSSFSDPLTSTDSQHR